MGGMFGGGPSTTIKGPKNLGTDPERDTLLGDASYAGGMSESIYNTGGAMSDEFDSLMDQLLVGNVGFEDFLNRSYQNNLQQLPNYRNIMEQQAAVANDMYGQLGQNTRADESYRNTLAGVDRARGAVESVMRGYGVDMSKFNQGTNLTAHDLYKDAGAVANANMITQGQSDAAASGYAGMYGQGIDLQGTGTAMMGQGIGGAIDAANNMGGVYQQAGQLQGSPLEWATSEQSGLTSVSNALVQENDFTNKRNAAQAAADNAAASSKGSIWGTIGGIAGTALGSMVGMPTLGAMVGSQLGSSIGGS